MLAPLFSPFWNSAGPVLALVVVTVLLHWLLGGGRSWKEYRKGLWPLIVGKDGRLSTSKVQVTLWTYAVVLGLLLLVCYGKDFEGFDWDPEYLLLLGSPAAAALLAKTFTSTKVESGAVEKPPDAPAPKDVVTDDEGELDLFDFQYFLFNLVLLVIFGLQLVRTLSDPGRLGDADYFLPPLPIALVALTSVSAASYAAKKGLEAQTPVLLGAYPSVAAPHDKVKLTGKNLVSKRAHDAPGDDSPAPVRVTFGGRLGVEPTQPIGNNGFDELEVTLPGDAATGPAPVKLARADGTETEPLPFTVVAGGPQVSSVNPDHIVLGDVQQIAISGSRFGQKGAVAPSVGRVTLDGRELEIAAGNWSEDRLRADIPDLATARRAGFPTEPGSYELVVEDQHGRASTPHTVEIVGVVPVVTALRPNRVVLGATEQEIAITGSGFGASPDEGGAGVMLDGRELSSDGDGWWSDRHVRVLIPPLREARERGFSVPGDHDLILVDAHGRESEPRTLHLDENLPVITGVYPSTGTVGQRVRVFGKNLAPADAETLGTPEVLFGNLTGTNPRQPRGTDEVEVGVPEGIAPGPQKVRFVRADGAVAEELDFQVLSG